VSASALGVESLPGGFQIPHRRHRMLDPLARLARLRLRGFQRAGQLRQFRVDAFDAVACGLQLALLALQLSG
jgi:hypothetical protein